MTAPIQRTRHSTLPEGQGNFAGQFKHQDAQRDLWEFLLPYGHLRTAALHGGGVLEGLEISGSLNGLGLKVSPGLALDSGGRLLSLSVSDGADDLRVRLQAAPAEGGGTDGLASVGADGVAVDTAGLSGEQYVVIEWNETLVPSGGQPVYRLTPWLRLEPTPADPAHRWVMLAKVTLGDGAERGRVTSMEVGPRHSVTSLRDGVTLTRPHVVTHPLPDPGRLTVEQVPTTGLRARAAGGLDVGVWSGSPPRWQTAVSVDGDNGHVSMGMDPADAFRLAVGGAIQATNVSTDELSVNEVQARKVMLQGSPLPIIRAGATDPATTPWEKFEESPPGSIIPVSPLAPNCVSVVVDTSAAGFTGTPLYFASLGGNRSRGDIDHTMVTGINAICSPTPTSFKLFLSIGNPFSAEFRLSPDLVRAQGLCINWVGILAQ